MPRFRFRFRSHSIAAGLMAMTVLSPLAARAQATAAAPASNPAPATVPTSVPTSVPAAAPPGLIGAWGSDSSCTSDVAIFRADGLVINPAAPSGTPPLAYAVSGGGITLSDGKQSGTFAFALSDQAVAWSNGASMVLKERCADQAPFASAMTAAPGLPAAAPAAIPAGPLPDQLRALAGRPLPYQGSLVQIQSVLSQTPQRAIYTDVTALPDSQAIPGAAKLFYRVFPTAAAAASYVSLANDDQASFVREPRGAGFFSTASAVDEGPGDSKSAPITISCLRFHPKRLQAIVVSCFAQMPGSRLVAGAQRNFALPRVQTAGAKDMGPQDDLTQTLALTGSVIGQLRGFLAAYPQP
ncbi:hypothetical protein [Acidisoma silvae]|uniref:C-type lysozyme inhibitor domain-containing protein n=1 Tax=Acidisoma silvae TaxID=2802396 RepID=A0A963YNW8_9PROT|nr:hypothetical protein [Acidisoma silvae]MCB8874026.1 hypothetical protein [Acidisoma silvae]